jgi:lysophospholipase L1-like esterase
MKKFVVSFLCIVAVISSLFLFGGCNNKEPLLIVYLGDSIAEALAGPSPLSEREHYGYYGVIGIRNEYTYRNRAVSGSRSADLLRYIQKDDEDARILRTLLKDADIIHISILGNDLLLSDLSGILIAALDEDYTKVDQIVENARENISGIVSTLREYNSHGVIIFQNVYNPIHPDSLLLNEEMHAAMEERGVAPEEYKVYGDIILNKVNGVLDEYAEAHPGEIQIINAQARFNEICDEFPERGLRLQCHDGVHPSSYGHAVLADLCQELLEELELADKATALKNYKSLRIEQLTRMYKGTSVNVRSVKAQIKKAKSCEEVTNIYFDATAGVTPNYF